MVTNLFKHRPHTSYPSDLPFHMCTLCVSVHLHAFLFRNSAHAFWFFVCVRMCQPSAAHMYMLPWPNIVLFLPPWSKSMCVCVWERQWERSCDWSLNTDVCVRVPVYTLEISCVNVCETTGKYSFADSLWWGVGERGARRMWGSCQKFGVLEIRAEIRR